MWMIKLLCKEQNSIVCRIPSMVIQTVLKWPKLIWNLYKSNEQKNVNSFAHLAVVLFESTKICDHFVSLCQINRKLQKWWI